MANPLNLRVGAAILAKRQCVVEYDEHNEKKVHYYGEPTHCCVTGVVKRALGKYVKGCGYYSYCGDDTPVMEPARLDVSRYIWLYECRVDIDTKPFLVHPDDIEVIQ